tara:strand:- start:6751 stop:7044 length:294 start_codon:yes stop_codon:yes gene_type:complete
MTFYYSEDDRNANIVFNVTLGFLRAEGVISDDEYLIYKSKYAIILKPHSWWKKVFTKLKGNEEKYYYVVENKNINVSDPNNQISNTIPIKTIDGDKE